MANSEDVQRDEERRTLIQLALGKASVAFMRQSAEVVMPTEELLEVAEDIHAVWALEVDNLAAEVRELQSELAVNEEIRLALEASNAELRRDRARLDWLERNMWVSADIAGEGELMWREAIDAALGGGEGEA